MNSLNRPQDAAPLYRQALQYSLENRGVAGTIRTRMENVLKAYVRARDWEEVTRFSAEARQRDPSFVESIGTTIKREAKAFADAMHELSSKD